VILMRGFSSVVMPSGSLVSERVGATGAGTVRSV